jgi:hypothetical protein
MVAADIKFSRSEAEMRIGEVKYIDNGERYNLRDIGIVSVEIINIDILDGFGVISIVECQETISISP